MQVRGGEKVFFELARAFPHADLFLLFGEASRYPADLRSRIRTTWLQKFPMKSAGYRSLLPLLPHAVDSIDLGSYDMVISSSSGWAHGLRPRADAHHLCYMHTPPRYLWGSQAPGRLAGGAQRLMAPLMEQLRRWDVAASHRVSDFVANSETTARRIFDSYRRSADVIYPPVDTERFLRLPREPRGYALYVGELVPYKRADLAIEACRLLKMPLVIIGDGPEMNALKRQAAGADVRFLGRAPDDVRDEVFSGASVLLYGGIEDFGIVFVEAMAAGVPIAGLRAGGLAEIGAAGGVSFSEQATAAGLAEAAARCVEAPALFTARDAARRFSIDEFRTQIYARTDRVC